MAALKCWDEEDRWISPAIANGNGYIGGADENFYELMWDMQRSKRATEKGHSRSVIA
jgi:hypothetical protein